MELSVERVKKEMIEIQYFGYSATDIYVDYRIAIDTKIKRLMIDIDEAHEEMGFELHEMKAIRYSLLTNYREFWSLIEPHMRTFYVICNMNLSVAQSVFQEELQKALNIPKNDTLELVSGNSCTEEEIEGLEKDIRKLQIDILREEYYLKCLQNYENILDKPILPLQDLSKKLSKMIERDLKSNQKDLEKIDNKVSEQLCKMLGGKSDNWYFVLNFSFLYKIDEKKLKGIEDHFESEFATTKTL